MAIGDFTITSTSHNVIGNRRQVSGTVEIGSAGSTSAIFPNNTIVDFNIVGNFDGVATAVPRVHINATDFDDNDDSYTKGSVHIDTNVTGPETFTWTATYI